MTQTTRRVIVTVATPDGEVLDRQEGTVRAGVRELVVMEVLPSTAIIEHTVAELSIGDPPDGEVGL